MSVTAATPIARERRNTTRFSTNLHVEVTAGERAWHARLVDISREGLCFVANAQLENDTAVEVSLPCMAFDAPAGFVNLRGRVRHCNGRRTGIEFVDMAPGDSSRLLELLYRAISARRPL